MDKEKILYLAKHNGKFTIRSCEYNGSVMDNLDYLIKHKMLIWETNDLWENYVGTEYQDLYDQEHHEYRITPDGEVLLSLFRLGYAHKNHKNQEKHIRRMDEFEQLLGVCGKSSEYFEKHLTKNQKKALEYCREIRLVPKCGTTLLEEPAQSTTISTNVSEFKSKVETIDLDEPLLTSMFNMSVGLGYSGADASRTGDYVLRKINEELGEMTLEMNIRDGLSYKEPGKDGVKGEAVDLAICALDMFALQCDGMSAEEMEREFLAYMLVKLNKWRNSLK